MRAIALFLFLALPLAAADEDRVKAAVERGAAFLIANNPAATGEFGIGPPCLAGIALLEADVKPGHPALNAIRAVVRNAAVTEVGTYQVSLAILFLDRLGNPADVACIQVLGARLMAGQGLTAGWGYATFDALTPEGAARAASAMNGSAKPDKLCPESQRIVNIVARGGRADAAVAGDDNSNTQFAIMGLWVARRSGLPTDTAFRRIQMRFLRTQSPADGGWAYTGGSGSAPSMTCAGLLGLAAAKASGEGQLVAVRTDAEGNPVEGNDDDPFLKPPAIGAKVETEDDAAVAPPAAIDPATQNARDKAIERALAGLGQLLSGAPGGLGGGNAGYGGTDDLYFYWSLERVGVAYGLDTIGSVDWYKWGLKTILDSQGADGSWGGAYTPNVTTAFAILFLKKANLTGDLTAKIGGKVKDPGGGELRGGRGGGITAAGTAQPKKGDPANPKAPGINAVRKTTEADKLAEDLLKATASEWPGKLRLIRESKGPQYTAALAQAIAVLEGRRLYQAREALAERFTRMTGDTLTRMLAERDAEVRRAACLAVAMKDERFVIPAMIDCITDPNEIVVRAAKASLKAMSNEDHGPASGATDEDKRKAADAWRAWYATDARKGR